MCRRTTRVVRFTRVVRRRFYVVFVIVPLAEPGCENVVGGHVENAARPWNEIRKHVLAVVPVIAALFDTVPELFCREILRDPGHLRRTNDPNGRLETFERIGKSRSYCVIAAAVETELALGSSCTRGRRDVIVRYSGRSIWFQSTRYDTGLRSG